MGNAARRERLGAAKARSKPLIAGAAVVQDEILERIEALRTKLLQNKMCEGSQTELLRALIAYDFANETKHDSAFWEAGGRTEIESIREKIVSTLSDGKALSQQAVFMALIEFAFDVATECGCPECQAEGAKETPVQLVQ